VECSTTASNAISIHPPAHPIEMSFTASEIKSIMPEPEVVISIILLFGENQGEGKSVPYGWKPLALFPIQPHSKLPPCCHKQHISVSTECTTLTTTTYENCSL
jgi:hypothetical protein